MDEVKNRYLKRTSDALEWKKRTDTEISPDAIRNMYHEMKRQGLIPPPDAAFTFVSPTANVPTHEIAFFEEDRQTRTGKSIFLVGDYIPPESLNLRPDQKMRNDGVGLFQYFRLDASRLPFKDNSVDVLWDRKGWLWHCSFPTNLKELVDALTEYHRVLRPHGCTIVDDIPAYEELRKKISVGTEFRIVFADLISYITGKSRKNIFTLASSREAHQFEESTGQRMRNLAFEHTAQAAIAHMNKLFEMWSFGTGKERIRALRKRA